MAADEDQREAEEERKKAESYKATADVERAYQLATAVKILMEYPRLNHLTASFARELNGMELKQEDADEKEAEENKKKEAQKAAKKAKEAADAAKKQAAEEPPFRQSPSPRDTQAHPRS